MSQIFVKERAQKEFINLAMHKYKDLFESNYGSFFEILDSAISKIDDL